MDLIFIIPGFMGTDLDSFVEYFRYDYIVHVCGIKGHTTNDKIGNYQSWINEVLAQYQMALSRYNKVYLIGFSMGGILASYLLHYYNSYKVKCVVLVNPAFHHKYYDSIKLHEFKFDYEKVKASVKRIPDGLIKAVRELKKLSTNAVNNEYVKYNKPTLLCISNYDNILLPYNFSYLVSNLKSYELRKYDTGHDLFNDSKRYELFYDIKTFFDKYN